MHALVPPRWSRRALALGSALPPLLLAALVWLYAVDVPVLDQWSLVEDLEKFASGTWGPGDWIRSHNGHRFALARLILVPLAFATGWNTRVEMALAIGIAGGLFAVFQASLRALGARLGVGPLRAVLPAVSLAVFSLAQWENWLWGLQVHVFLGVLLEVSALGCLARPEAGARSLGAALLLATLATFTHGSGLVLWPLGALVLLAPWQRPHLARGRAAGALLWCAVGAAVFAIYLHPWPGDVGGERTRYWLDHPLAFAYFALSTLGAPLVSFAGSAWPPHDSGAAFVAGGAGLAALACAVASLVRRPGATPAPLVHLCACALFSVGVAAQIALVRTSFGAPAAWASRYTTLTTPFWVATLALLAACAAAGRARWPRAALAACTALLVASSLVNAPVFRSRYKLLAPARSELARAEVDELLARLHPEVVQVHQGVGALRMLRLSVFRDDVPPLPPAARGRCGASHSC